MTPLQVIIGVTTAGVIAAVLGEALWLRLGLGLRAGPGPGSVESNSVGPLPTAALMVLGATPAAMLLARIDAHLWPAIGSLSPAALRSFWSDHPVLAAVAAFVVWDAAGWWYHRLGHRSSIGWAAHQVHHSGTSYDMTLAWRQSWFPVHAVVAFSPVAVLGVEPTTVLGCAAVSKLWQALVHTSIPITLPPWITAVVMTPATHRRHHTLDGGGSNLGPVLTIWDRLAGTWDPDPVPVGTPIGLRDAQPGLRRNRGAVSIEIEGWISLARCNLRNRPATRSATDYGSIHLVDATRHPETHKEVRPSASGTGHPLGPRARRSVRVDAHGHPGPESGASNHRSTPP